MSKQPKRTSPWKKTSEAAELLGVSSDWLHSMRPHWGRSLWRNLQSPEAMRATYQWHVPNIEDWLKRDASRR